MIPLSLKEIAQAVGGELSGGDLTVTCVTTDSRKVVSGSLFVAIRGERFDGADFIPTLEDTNCAVLCPKRVKTVLPAVTVDDTEEALGKLAKYYKKEKLDLDFTVAITGSVGKTTTKEMTSLCFESFCKTSKTEGNLNNHLGLPQTILAADPESRALVCEMGMNHKGEIDYLTKIACPNIAMITNIGTSHIEHLGSREGIAEAKLEITAGLEEKGKLILNGDEPLLRRKIFGFDTVYVGFDSSNDVWAENIVSNAEGVNFDACLLGERINVFLPAYGTHNVINALFAMTAATLAGASPRGCAEALRNYKPVGMRQKILKSIGGATAIIDCYNANPESMAASLEVLYQLESEGKKIAVLGDMLELGERSDECHYELGKKAAGADILLLTGDMAYKVKAGAVSCGMKEKDIYIFEEKKELCDMITSIERGGDIFLFKASRGIRLEDAVPEAWQD